MYMSSLGNRPDLFPQSGYVSKYYENPPADYEVPAALDKIYDRQKGEHC
jgi:hypothetical protein